MRWGAGRPRREKDFDKPGCPRVQGLGVLIRRVAPKVNLTPLTAGADLTTRWDAGRPRRPATTLSSTQSVPISYESNRELD